MEEHFRRQEREGVRQATWKEHGMNAGKDRDEIWKRQMKEETSLWRQEKR